MNEKIVEEMQQNIEAITKAVNTQEKAHKFSKELESLINRYSKENDSNTPDFILAQYIASCLSAFNVAVQKREDWWGRDLVPTPTVIADVKYKGGKE